MTWTLDTPVRIGPMVFAAIAEVQVSVNMWGGRLVAAGDKRPVLALMVQGDSVMGVGLDGERVPPDEIEARFPDALAQLRAHLAERD